MLSLEVLPMGGGWCVVSPTVTEDSAAVRPLGIPRPGVALLIFSGLPSWTLPRENSEIKSNG